MTTQLNPNSSVTELSKFLEQNASNNISAWHPTGFLSYPRLINRLERYLKDKASEYLPKERVSRLDIKTTVNRDNGAINVEITERQPRLKAYLETRLALRPCSEIVKWIAKIL